MKGVLFNWRYYCFKLYTYNYALFVIIFNFIDMQNKAMMQLQNIHYCWHPIVNIYDIITPKSNQNLEMILYLKFLGLNPMILSATLGDYKNHDCFIISYYRQKNCNELIWRAYVPLGPTLIYKTEDKLPTLTTKLWLISLNNCRFHTKTMINSLETNFL